MIADSALASKRYREAFKALQHAEAELVALGDIVAEKANDICSWRRVATGFVHHEQDELKRDALLSAVGSGADFPATLTTLKALVDHAAHGVGENVKALKALGMTDVLLAIPARIKSELEAEVDAHKKQKARIAAVRAVKNNERRKLLQLRKSAWRAARSAEEHAKLVKDRAALKRAGELVSRLQAAEDEGTRGK